MWRPHRVRNRRDTRQECPREYTTHAGIADETVPALVWLVDRRELYPPTSQEFA